MHGKGKAVNCLESVMLRWYRSTVGRLALNSLNKSLPLSTHGGEKVFLAVVAAQLDNRQDEQ